MDVSHSLGFFLAHLLEDFQSGDVLALLAMYANLMCQHPGTADVPVCGPHQSGGNSTFDVSAFLILGFLPLCCKASG